MTRLLPLILLLAAGCAATKEQRVRTALTDAGLPPATAQCMAEPMARDLSVEQLKSIGRLARGVRSTGRTMSERQLVELMRRDLDPQTVGVVVRAGLGCFLRG